MNHGTASIKRWRVLAYGGAAAPLFFALLDVVSMCPDGGGDGHSDGHSDQVEGAAG